MTLKFINNVARGLHKFNIYILLANFIHTGAHTPQGAPLELISETKTWTIGMINDFAWRISFMSFENESLSDLCLKWFIEVRLIIME